MQILGTVAKRSYVETILERLQFLRHDAKLGFRGPHLLLNYGHGNKEAYLADSCGMCYCMAQFGLDGEPDELYRLWLYISQELFQRWPSYSGDPIYPVPGVSNMCEATAYSYYKSMWEGAYGAKRMALLDYLISALSAELGL